MPFTQTESILIIKQFRKWLNRNVLIFDNFPDYPVNYVVMEISLDQSFTMSSYPPHSVYS